MSCSSYYSSTASIRCLFQLVVSPSLLCASTFGSSYHSKELDLNSNLLRLTDIPPCPQQVSFCFRTFGLDPDQKG